MNLSKKNDPLAEIAVKSINDFGLRVDNEIISTVIRAHISMLKSNTAKREILFWGFNHLLGMFELIKDYPKENQIELRRLLQASITFWVKCLHERLLVVVNNTKKQVRSDVHSLIDDSSRIFVSAAKIYVKLQTMPTPAVLDDAAELAQTLTPCAHHLLDLIYALDDIVEEREEFLKTISDVIEKIKRHRDIIGDALIIDEMLIDYSRLLEEENEKDKKKQQIKDVAIDFAVLAVGGVPGLIAKKTGWNPIGKLIKKCKK